MMETKLKPGQKGGPSPNPAGRPKGSVDRREIYSIIKGDLPAILAKMVEQAKAGDAAAARLLLDRSIPVVRAGDLPTALPLAGTTPVERAQSVLAAVEAGETAPAEATTAMQLIGAAAQIATATELLQRIETLERRLVENVVAEQL